MGNLTKKPVVLVIADGLGLSANWQGNAVAGADENFFRLWSNYTHGVLKVPALAEPFKAYSQIATGESPVGQNDPSMEMLSSAEFLTALDSVKRNNGSVHLIGEISYGQNRETLLSILKALKRNSVLNAYLHLIVDASFPSAGILSNSLAELESSIIEKDLGEIGSLVGSETLSSEFSTALQAFFARSGRMALSIDQALSNQQNAYPAKLQPTVLKLRSDARIKDFDLILFFSPPGERMQKMITNVLLLARSNSLPEKAMFLKFISLYPFPFDMKDDLLFLTKENKSKYLVPEIEKAGLKELLICPAGNKLNLEYYLLGDKTKIDEKVVQAESDGKSTTDELARIALSEIANGRYDFFIINFDSLFIASNRNFAETVSEMKKLDQAIGLIAKETLEKDGYMILCSAFGGAESMVAGSERKSDNVTRRSDSYFLPFVVVSRETEHLRKGDLVTEILHAKEDLTFIHKILIAILLSEQ